MNAKSCAYIALGKIAIAVKEEFLPYLDSSVQLVRAAFRPNQLVKECILCISMFCTGLGAHMERHLMKGSPPCLLELLFLNGLNEALTVALKDISTSIRTLSKPVTDRLLNLIAWVLSKQPFYYAGTPVKLRKRFESQTGSNFFLNFLSLLGSNSFFPKKV